MPRTFIAHEKRFIDGRIIDEGQKFTTSKFDDGKLKVPKTLEEVGGKGDSPKKEPAQKTKEPTNETGSGGDKGDGYTEAQLKEMSNSDLGKIAKKLKVDNYTKMGPEDRVTAILSMQEQIRITQDTTTSEGNGIPQKVDSGNDVTPA